MEGAGLMIGRQPHGRNGATYVCADEVMIHYRQEVFEIQKFLVMIVRYLNAERPQIMPRNGI